MGFRGNSAPNKADTHKPHENPSPKPLRSLNKHPRKPGRRPPRLTLYHMRVSAKHVAQNTNPLIGVLIIRRGFWGPFYTLVLIRNPQNSIGNCLGTYIRYQEPGNQDHFGTRTPNVKKTLHCEGAGGWIPYKRRMAVGYVNGFFGIFHVTPR